MFLVRAKPARVGAKAAETHRSHIQADDTVPRMEGAMNTHVSDIEARAEAATKGPWQRSHFVDGPHYRGVSEEKKQEWRACERYTIRGPGVVGTPECNIVLSFGRAEEADLDFIAHAREDIPYLLAELKAKEETLAAVRATSQRHGAASSASVQNLLDDLYADLKGGA